VSLTDRILREFKQKIKTLELAPYDDGRFEVIVGKKTIYSKLETGEFPEDDDILAALKKG